MHIEQFVMAYEVEQDRLRALVPHGFKSLRPVLRINAEIRGGTPYVEFNTAVEAQDGTRGWINEFGVKAEFLIDHARGQEPCTMEQINCEFINCIFVNSNLCCDGSEFQNCRFDEDVTVYVRV